MRCPDEKRDAVQVTLDQPIAIPSLYPSFRTGIHWTVEDVRGQVGLGVNPGVREQSADGGSA